jgi:hypothetical protein
MKEENDESEERQGRKWPQIFTGKKELRDLSPVLPVSRYRRMSCKAIRVGGYRGFIISKSKDGETIMERTTWRSP